MFNFDSDLIQTLIAATASIISAIIGVFIGRDHSYSKTIKQLHTDQLIKLYEPIVSILLFNNGPLTEYQIAAITTLLSKNNSLAAPQIIETWKQFIDSDRENHQAFQKVLDSNYNWVKKCLGHPYDRNSIRIEYLPKRKIGKKAYIGGIILAILGVALLIRFAKLNSIFIKLTVFFPLLIISYTIGYYCLVFLFREISRI